MNDKTIDENSGEHKVSLSGVTVRVKALLIGCQSVHALPECADNGLTAAHYAFNSERNSTHFLTKYVMN